MLYGRAGSSPAFGTIVKAAQEIGSLFLFRSRVLDAVGLWAYNASIILWGSRFVPRMVAEFLQKAPLEGAFC